MRYTKGYSNDKTDEKKQIDMIISFYQLSIIIHPYSPTFTRLRVFHKIGTHEIPNYHYVVVKSGEWIPKWIP